MKYVYILESVADAERHYTGITDDLRARLIKHNSGDVSYTSKFKPWRLNTYLAFSDERRALFENFIWQGLRQEKALDFDQSSRVARATTWQAIGSARRLPRR